MGAITFDWGSATGIKVLGKHQFVLDEDNFQFNAAFEASPDTFAAAAAGQDEEMKDQLVVSHGYTQKNKAFKLKIGTEEIFSFDPTANTGFLTHATITNPGGRTNTGRFAMWNFSVVGQRPATADSRLGRRTSSVSISRKADGLRMISFGGVWTAIPGSPATDAVATYDANIDAWVDTWITGIGPFTAGTASFWINTSETPLEVDEQNKVIRFARQYTEYRYISIPNEADDNAPAGTITAAKFFNIPNVRIGQADGNVRFNSLNVGTNYGSAYKPARDFSGGTNVGTRSVVSGGGGGGAEVTPNEAPGRYGFIIDVMVLGDYGNPKEHFEAIGLAWVRDTLSTLWSESASAVIDSLNVTVTDATERRAQVSGAVVVPSAGGLLDYEESIAVSEPQTDQFAAILNGNPHNYDVTSMPPVQTAQQQVTIRTLGPRPTTPSFLRAPWALTSQSESHQKAKIGWARGPGEPTKNEYVYTFTRGYLRVDFVGGSVSFPNFNPFGSVITG